MTTRINLLSGPRNISTALMYSFASRSDTTVVDEPLYAHYLRVSGANHPGREDILQSQDSDGDRVIKNCMRGECATPVIFFKNMAHHFLQVDLGALRSMTHLFLIRDPRSIIASYARVRPKVALSDIGLNQQVTLYNTLTAAGEQVVVLDSGDLLADPPAMLPQLCQALGIEPDPAMLSWPAGPRPEDGVWAVHWYSSVHRSTGFKSPPAQTAPFPEQYQSILKEALPLYHKLHAVRLV